MGRPARSPGQLTPRESEVVSLLAEGLRDKEIGQRLYISPHTVGATVCRASKALGARNRAHLVALSYRTGQLSAVPGSLSGGVA